MLKRPDTRLKENPDNKIKEKGKHTKPRLAAAVILLLLSGGGMILAAAHPGFAQWYAACVYPVLVATLGRASGWIPFSVAEITGYILIAAFILTLARTVAAAVRARGAGWTAAARPDTDAEDRAEARGQSTDAARPDADAQAGAEAQEQDADTARPAAEGTRDICGSQPTRSPASIAASWLSGVLLTVGILAFLYTVCCGINYQRRSFSEEESIVTHEYTSGELKAICLWLTEEVNARADQVARDADGVMQTGASEKAGAVRAMESLAEEFPSLRGYYPAPKELIVSEVLSYQGLTGIYLPFFVEANYNGDMTDYNIPFTACHELSHLRGFMQEQEANFIAFLACVSSERADFQYSGYLSGWVYCMNALYRADQESWREVRGALDAAAEPDLAANNAFWERHEGAISETAEKINDTYLKANGQADGVKSYDRMVDLIVAYFGEKI